MQINELKPKRVGLIFDGWTFEGEHFISIFITFIEEIKFQEYIRKIFICCEVQDETNLERLDSTAESIGDYLFDELQLVGLDMFENVDFVVGDNEPVNIKLVEAMNKRIARDKGNAAHVINFVGCASHRLNLARKLCMQTMDDQRAQAIDKVDELI
jgi:hypothetical protein